MTGILLAGGESKRMGTDKAFLEFNKRKLFEYPLAILTSLCNEILISSADSRYEITGFPVIPDKYPGQGPMAGIYTCLSIAKYPKSLILSCDLPMMDEAFIKLIVDRSKDFSATMGRNRKGKPEPMAGVYKKSLAHALETSLKKGENKLQTLFEMVNTQYIDPSHEGFDPDLIYLNVNSPKDFQYLINHPPNIGKNG